MRNNNKKALTLKISAFLLHFEFLCAIMITTHFGAPGCHHNTVGGFSPLARGRLKALCFHRALLRRKSVAQGVTRVTAFEIITIILAALTLLVTIIGIIVKLIIELINAKK